MVDCRNITIYLTGFLRGKLEIVVEEVEGKGGRKGGEGEKGIMERFP